MASPYDEFQQPAQGENPYAEFQPATAAREPSIGQRALSNLPRSIGNLARTAFPVTNEQLPINPAERHVRGPIEDIGNLVKDIGSRVMHPQESFAEDPAGTVAIPALLASGGIRALQSPAGEAAFSKVVPQTFNPIPHIGRAVSAAAPNVIKGGIKAGIGIGGAEMLPEGLQWPARAIFAYPGLRQAYRGLKIGGRELGGGTTEEAVANLPTYNPGSSPESAMLDKIAQGFGYKNFASAPESAQTTMQGVANRMGSKAAAPVTPRPAQEPVPESRRLTAPARIITTPPPEDTSGVIHGWKPTILPREGEVKVSPETPDLRISSPAPPAGTIPVPETAVKGAVENLEHPPFAKDRPFPKSKKIREQTSHEETKGNVAPLKVPKKKTGD